MKYYAAIALALQGAIAFPAVLNNVLEQSADDFAAERRGTVEGESGCTVSKLCNTPLEISDAQIGYDANAPTAAQKSSAARSNCGAIVSCVEFDATEQYVSTTGNNAYASPLPSQIRGPCPGLNAAANHNYLPRSGVPNILQTITGLGQMYAMSAPLAGFLAAFAVAIDGDVLTASWSIGGPQGGLLSNAQGISWSHNKYEGDTSIGRCDAYTNGGDAHSLSTTRFGYAYAAGMEDDSYTPDTVARVFAKNTFRSVAQNKYYFAPLFATTLVSPAAYNFVPNMMSNHSKESIGGYFNGAMFKEFFAITGDYPNFTWLPGQERIPTSPGPWYRRPYSTPYTFAGIVGDLVSQFLAYPNSFRFGGNTGKTDSYVGVNLTDFSGGVYNAGNIFQGNNLQCLIYQNIQQGLPDVLTTSPLTSAGVKLLSPYLDQLISGVTCPSVAKFNDNDFPPYAGRQYFPSPPPGNVNNC